MNSRPLKRPPRSIAFPDRLDIRRNNPHLLMTIHADLCCGNICERGGLDSGVAIPAVDAESAGVMFMAEWNRLLARNLLPRLIRRLDDEVTSKGGARQKQHDA